MSIFVCPVCGEPLNRLQTAWRCAHGHSFDIASSGYVNLLPTNRRRAADPGDDAGMALARCRFLSGGYYQPLRDALERLAAARTGEAVTLLDSGCGEGYYTAGIVRALREAGKRVDAAGIDLSKHALRRAAKREPAADFAVASAYCLPVRSGSVSLLVNCFSPLAPEEFRRVTMPGGAFLYVVPGAEHLWELKQLLYENPYRNREQRVEYPGFSLRAVERVEGRMSLPDRQTIHDLFQMTPYFWKTPKEGAEWLSACDRLDCSYAFDIHVFQRTSE